MDPVTPSENDNLVQSRLQTLLQRKWLIILAWGGGLLVLFILVLLLRVPTGGPPAVEQAPLVATPRPTEVSRPPTAAPTPNPTKVAEQMAADAGFAEWERNVKANYPWFQRIPLRTGKYFVYFDLDKAKFVGLLYPGAADDVEEMKSEIRR